MNDIQKEVTQMLRKAFEREDYVDTPGLDLSKCSKESLVQILDAMRIYCMSQRKMQAFDEDYSDVMGAIAKKLNTKVWP